MDCNKEQELKKRMKLRNELLSLGLGCYVKGPTGPQGIQGPTGPTGPQGEQGIADTITIGNTITGEAGTEAKVSDTTQSNIHVLNFTIPKGETGPAGPTFLRSAYIVTFNDEVNPNGIEIQPNTNLPLNRVELDASNLVKLDTDNNLIKFDVIGYYKISFKISAYPKVDSVDFDSTKDIVSVGFKETGTDNVYVGVGEFVFNGEPVQLSASGIISVVDTNISFELANLGKYPIYLETPLLSNINSNSYFANPLVTIVIDYLGRQGT